MSGPIRKLGLGNVPLYGSRRATFLIKDMNGYRSKKLATALCDGLRETDENCNCEMYNYFAKGFSDEQPFYDESHDKIANPSLLKSPDQLETLLHSSKCIFLLSEFLDTQKATMNGDVVSYYPQIFGAYGEVAILERDSKSFDPRRIPSDIIFSINNWKCGIPFDTLFLYQIGQRFGKLIKSS